MKIFILLAIIFFSWRVFSQEAQYDVRYYKIDDYIRYQDDPNYDQYLKYKKIQSKIQKKNRNIYFEEREWNEAQQEKSRLQYLAELDARPPEQDNSHLEKLYLKEKEIEQKQYEQDRIAYLEEQTKLTSQPARMIASNKSEFYSVDEDGQTLEPRNRTKRDSRKFILKSNKMPKRK